MTRIPAPAGLALAAMIAAASVTGPAFAQSSGEEGEPAVTVEMTGDLMFHPQSVTIAPGETVEWRNVSDVRHTVTLDPEEAFRDDLVDVPEGAETIHSGFIEPGETFRYTFEQPGRYGYFCVPHQASNMAGEVIVEESGGGN